MILAGFRTSPAYSTMSCFLGEHAANPTGERTNETIIKGSSLLDGVTASANEVPASANEVADEARLIGRVWFVSGWRALHAVLSRNSSRARQHTHVRHEHARGLLTRTGRHGVVADSASQARNVCLFLFLDSELNVGGELTRDQRTGDTCCNDGKPAISRNNTVRVGVCVSRWKPTLPRWSRRETLCGCVCV